ncbi:pentatricopeptide repeat-containing protein At5g39350-like [Ipomoea triloba]|uniref:pentatricopeptide repeat-containing protein At5g39350-like n=1 Tax=Ipomoea triloba TaxID=35885 RepID=UPI00125DC2D4|nr:pentatricopeptide repeat-containing protein At5g39350-like [Ipomoea triloba]
MKLWNFYRAFSSLPAYYTGPLSVIHLNRLLQLSSNFKTLRHGKQTHQQIIVHGVAENPFIITKLIQMYADCGDVHSAYHLFDELPQPNVFAWTALLSFFSRNGLFYECVSTYCEMKVEGILPDKYVFPRVLRACSLFSCLEVGVQVHKDVVVCGVEQNVHVGNSLIDMYSRCGDLRSSRLVFDLMIERDLLSWNSMISGYVCNNFLALAMEMLGLMRMAGFQPDIVTFNILMDAHCRVGQCDEALEICKQIKDPTIVSWTTLMSGYSRIGKHDISLQIFGNVMNRGEIYADLDCLSSALSSCQHMKALRSGQEIHAYGIKVEQLHEFYQSAGPALLSMYSKCGKIEYARCVFDLVDKCDVVAWNAMILGFAEQGAGNSAIECFRKMQNMRIKNDQTTITTILPVCDLKYGKQIHAYVCKATFGDAIPVWNALVYMYAKCGCIQAAYSVFSRMGNKDLVSWNTMIGGFGMHGLGKASLQLLQEMNLSGIRPNSLTFTSALSACSHSGLVDEGLEIFQRMTQHYCLSPRTEHFTCIVDLLTRAGRLEEAVDFITRMPVEPGKHIWGSLLAAALAHQNLDIGVLASESLVKLEPENPGHYVTLSNMYTRAGRTDDAVALRKKMEGTGLVKQFGRSWVATGN